MAKQSSKILHIEKENPRLEELSKRFENNAEIWLSMDADEIKIAFSQKRGGYKFLHHYLYKDILPAFIHQYVTITAYMKRESDEYVEMDPEEESYPIEIVLKADQNNEHRFQRFLLKTSK